ncbi:MAG TPA: hypothetical protein VHY35_01860 [Stellaceae bacterium]|nr:hypothetical protein [Stellaceae bacterium]
MSLAKSAILSVALVAGAAVAAHAQSNVASLPPATAATTPTPGYGAYPGPNPGGSWSGAGAAAQAAVAPSAPYVGPSPGGSNGSTPPHFDKSADWDSNTALHPYTSSMGPRPN